MKKSKLLAAVLASLMLLYVLSVPASAEGTINFIPELKGGKVYGTALKTPQTAYQQLYKKDKIVIYNLDGKTVEADSQEYMGTGYTVKLNDRLFYSVVVRGDIDGDGELKMMDYVLVKRACLGTFKINSLQREAACVEPGGTLRAINYIKVKRAYFGTYDINKDYTCEPYDPGQGNDGWSDGWV